MRTLISLATLLAGFLLVVLSGSFPENTQDIAIIGGLIVALNGFAFLAIATSRRSTADQESPAENESTVIRQIDTAVPPAQISPDAAAGES